MSARRDPGRNGQGFQRGSGIRRAGVVGWGPLGCGHLGQQAAQNPPVLGRNADFDVEFVLPGRTGQGVQMTQTSR